MPTLVIECINNMGKKGKDTYDLIFMDKAKDVMEGKPEKDFNLETTNKVVPDPDVSTMKADLTGIEIEISKGTNNEMDEGDAYDDLNDMAEASADNASDGGDTMNDPLPSENQENEVDQDEDETCEIFQ